MEKLMTLLVTFLKMTSEEDESELREEVVRQVAEAISLCDRAEKRLKKEIAKIDDMAATAYGDSQVRSWEETGKQIEISPEDADASAEWAIDAAMCGEEVH